jgi:dihydroxy-acid dehydratase
LPAGEIEKRLRSWQRPEPKYTSGVFAKYIATVATSSRGAVTC